MFEKEAKLVEEKTGWYAHSAFEYKDTIYVLASPVKDFDPEEDTAYCYFPVKDMQVGESMSFSDLILLGLDLKDPDFDEAMDYLLPVNR